MQATVFWEMTAHIANIDSQYNVWGLGIVQNIDAAAMELYMGYRTFKFEEAGTADVSTTATSTCFSAGARIKF